MFVCRKQLWLPWGSLTRNSFYNSLVPVRMWVGLWSLDAAGIKCEQNICRMLCVDTNYIFCFWNIVCPVECVRYSPFCIMMLYTSLSLLPVLLLIAHTLIPASMIYSCSSLHLVLFVLLVLEEIHIYGHVSLAYVYLNRCCIAIDYSMLCIRYKAMWL